MTDFPRAITSASNIARRALCPGSERMEAGLPDEDSQQAKEGELLHAYAANPKLDRSFLKPNQRDLLDISEKCDDMIFERVKEQFGISDADLWEEGTETQLVALADRDGATPGQCDRWRYYPQRSLLVIIDRKFGYKIVTPAAANFQLRVYAIGGAAKWLADKVVVAITQPRLPYEERITMAAYSATDIDDACIELAGIRALARNPQAPLIAAEEQCRYCKAKLICPEFRRHLQLTVIPTTGTKTGKLLQIERTLAAECTDGDLEKVLLACSMADFVKDIARDEGRKRKKLDPNRLPNYMLGKEGEVRKIIDPARAISLLALRGDLTRDEILNCSNPSLTKVEEKIRTKRKFTWKQANEYVDETLKSVLAREPKKAQLTRKI